MAVLIPPYAKMPSSNLLAVFLFSIYLVLASAQETCAHVTACLQQLESGGKCDLFPMPVGSLLSPIRPLGYNVTEIRPGVYSYNDGVYQSILIYSSEAKHLIAIDFPFSATSLNADGTYRLTNATIEILKDDSPERITMVYSHRHTDHIGEAMRYRTFINDNFVNAMVEIVGTQETVDFLTGNSDVDIPVPTLVLSENPTTVSVESGLSLELSVVAGHTNADVLSYIAPSGENKGIIYIVDIVSPRAAPDQDFGVTVDLGKYMSLHDTLVKVDFDVYLSGHGRIGDKQDLQTNSEYTKSVVDAMIMAHKQLDRAAVGAVFGRVRNPADAAFGNIAFSIAELLNLRVEMCKKTVIEQWGCQLATVDVVAGSHCRSARVFVVTSLQEDL